MRTGRGGHHGPTVATLHDNVVPGRPTGVTCRSGVVPPLRRTIPRGTAGSRKISRTGRSSPERYPRDPRTAGPAADGTSPRAAAFPRQRLVAVRLRPPARRRPDLLRRADLGRGPDHVPGPGRPGARPRLDPARDRAARG